jgi:hypothetical protein
MTTKEDSMAMLTLVEAARKIGLATLARAIKSGRLSVSRKADGSHEIDPAELARLYPFTAPGGRHATADADRYRISQARP